MLYREYALKSIKERGKIIKSEDAGLIIEKARNKLSELYFSVYEYDEEILEHLQIRKTVSNYRGKYYLNQIILDIDNHDQKLDDKYYKSIILEKCEDIMDEWELEPEHIRIAYSGRGYHIILPNIFDFQPSNNLPQIVKKTIDYYFQDVDSSIYSNTGLIRANYSLNAKVDRYKIPFTFQELKELQVEEILELSRKGDKRKLIKIPVLEKIFPDRIIRVDKTKKITEVDGSNEHIISCIQKIYDKSNQDNRHPKMLRLVSAWKRQGITKHAIKLLLKEWVSRQPILDRPIKEYEITRMIDDAFKANWNFTCHDGIMAEHCDTRCMFYKKKNYNIEVATNTSMEAEYKRFVKSGGLESAYDLKSFVGSEESFKMYPGELTVVWGDTGVGKGVRLNQLLPTPQGYRKAIDMKIGDKLFDAEGKPTKITNISNINYLDNYKCTFDDQSSVIVDADHLWEINRKINRNTKKVTSIRSTQWLYEHNVKKPTRRKFSIPITNPVEYKRQYLILDPYLLGLWLGDGDSKAGRITTADKELLTYFENSGYYVKAAKQKYHYQIHKLIFDLREINVLKNKHIPERYLLSSIDQRKELLMGLMDTDGYVNKKGTLQFSQSNYDFIIQVKELLSSLGLKSRLTFKDPKIGKRNYVLTFTTNFPVFKLKRKLNRQKFNTISTQSTRRFFDKIEKVKSEPTICFEVDNSRKLYLVGKDYIVTHNSAFVQSWMVNYPNKKILYLTLEVPRMLMFRRFMQIANSMTETEVNQHLRYSDISLAQDLAHISVLDIAPKLEEVDNLIIKNQPNIVVIDTAGDIDVGKVYGDPMVPIIKKFRDMLSRHPISIIAVHHISKEAAKKRKKNEKLTLHDGKGDSILEQKADNVIAINGEKDNSLRIVESLKARDKTPFSVKMDYKWETFNYLPWVYS